MISGKLPDPNYASRPVGVNALEVYLFNDAAAGLPATSTLSGMEGEWTLRPLPGGDYAVFEVSDTPFPKDVSIRRKALNEEIAAGLSGKTPESRYAALQKWDKERPLWQIPLIIEMIDSTDSITIPGNGHHVLGYKTTLGALARGSLMRTAATLDAHPSIRVQDDKRAWTRWWADQLKVSEWQESAPVPGETIELSRLESNQSHPEFQMSPDGESAIVGFSRLDHPTAGARSGILYYRPASDVTGRFIYKVPLSAVNSEPTNLRAAWTVSRVGLVWREQSIWFLTMDRMAESVPVPIDLKVKDAEKLSLITHGQGWALVYTDKNKSLYVQTLDPSGHVQGKPRLIDLSSAIKFESYESIFDLSATATDSGAAISIGGGAGAFLIRLDSKLNLQTITKFSDSSLAHTYYRTPVGWNGREFCIPWLAADNGGEKLYVSFFDGTGTQKGTARLLSRTAEFLAIPSEPLPVPYQDGFLVIWGHAGEPEHEIRFAKVASSESEFTSKVLFKGTSIMDPMAIGANAKAIRAMLLDKATYPFRVIVKRMSE